MCEGLQGRRCGVGRGSSGGVLLCRRLGLRYLGRCVFPRCSLLHDESGVYAFWRASRRLESVGDGFGEWVCLCVGRGREPWLLGFLLD